MSAEFFMVIIVFSKCSSLRYYTSLCKRLKTSCDTSSLGSIERKSLCPPNLLPSSVHDQFFFYRRSLPQALRRASLCPLKVLACVEVSLSLPSVPLNGSAPTLTLEHFKGRPKGGWANTDMRRRPCNKAGGWEGRGNQWLLCSNQEKVHCYSLPEVKSSFNESCFSCSDYRLSFCIPSCCFYFVSFFAVFFRSSSPHDMSRKYQSVTDKDVKQVLVKC